VLITSRQNPRVKEVRALLSRKERDRSGLFFIDGFQAVAEAIRLRAGLELLIVAPERLPGAWAHDLVAGRRNAGLPCLEVSGEVFDTLAAKGGQGIGAVVRQCWEPLDRLRPADDLCWVALADVQYPGNLGTILRTADAVGASGVILLGQTTDPYDPLAVRASLGTILSQRLVRTSLDEFAAWKRRHGVAVVGAAPTAPTDYRAAAYPAPVVLLMGGERRGLSPEQEALCDALVRIPMVGRRDSLNLAIAAGLMLYEVFRRHHPSGTLMRQP
jgi:TrmH family RNA methyltransferase